MSTPNAPSVAPDPGVLVKAGVYDRVDCLSGLALRAAIEDGIRLDAGALSTGPIEWYVVDDDLHTYLAAINALARWSPETFRDLMAACDRLGTRARAIVATVPVADCPAGVR